MPFRRSYKLPPNCRCQSLCTAGTRMSDFWHCLIRLDSLPVQYCTALPVHASKCRPVWTEGSISVLPGGFATNDADLSYVNSTVYSSGKATDRNRRAVSVASRSYAEPNVTTQRARVSASHPERIALWRGEDPQWLAAMTDANARTLFEVVF